MSELVVVCSRVCPLPTPPAGVQLSVLPPLFWRVFLGSLPPGLAPQAVLQLDAARDNPAQEALARALADAGAGVVLSYLPVTMPARFAVLYDGREPARPLPRDAEAVLERAREHQAEHDRAVAAEAAARAAAKAAFVPDPAAEDWSELRAIFDDKP